MDDLITRCNRLQSLFDNDVAELKQGVQGDILDQYSQLIDDESVFLGNIKSIIEMHNNI